MQYSWSCSNRSGRSQTLILVVQAGQRCRSVAEERSITSTHLAQRPPLLSRSAYILPISPMPINPMVASSGAGSLAAVEEEEELMARWGGGDEMTALSVGGSVVGPRRR